MASVPDTALVVREKQVEELRRQLLVRMWTCNPLVLPAKRSVFHAYRFPGLGAPPLPPPPPPPPPLTLSPTHLQTAHNEKVKLQNELVEAEKVASLVTTPREDDVTQGRHAPPGGNCMHPIPRCSGGPSGSLAFDGRSDFGGGDGPVLLMPLSPHRATRPASTPLDIAQPHSAPTRIGPIQPSAERFSTSVVITNMTKNGGPGGDVLSTLAGCQALLRKKDLEITMLREKLWPVPGEGFWGWMSTQGGAAPECSTSRHPHPLLVHWRTCLSSRSLPFVMPLGKKKQNSKITVGPNGLFSARKGSTELIRMPSIIASSELEEGGGGTGAVAGGR